MAVIVGGSAILSQADSNQLEAWLERGAITLTKVYALPDSPQPIEEFWPNYYSALGAWAYSKGIATFDVEMFVVLSVTHNASGSAAKIGGYAHHFGRPTVYSRTAGAATAAGSNVVVLALTGGGFGVLEPFAAAGRSIVPGMSVIGAGVDPGTLVSSVVLNVVTLSKPSTSGIANGAQVSFLSQRMGYTLYPERTAFVFNLTSGKRWMQRNDGDYEDTRRPPTQGTGRLQAWGLLENAPCFGGGHDLVVNETITTTIDAKGVSKHFVTFADGRSSLYSYGSRPDGAALLANVFDDTPDVGPARFTVTGMELFGVS